MTLTVEIVCIEDKLKRKISQMLTMFYFFLIFTLLYFLDYRRRFVRMGDGLQVLSYIVCQVLP